MTATLTLTVDRSSLSLADLTIDSEGFGNYTVAVGGYSEPDTSPRIATARSPYVYGDLVTGFTLDTSTLALIVTVKDTTTALLETKCEALRRALCRQAVYTIVRTLDSQSQTWRCQPAGMTRTGPVTKGEVRGFEATYSITVPVYPIPGS